VVGFLVYARPQPLLPEAGEALASDGEVQVSVVGDDLVFRPTGAPPHLGLVLYPGGKVPAAAYAPAAHRIAALSGALVRIVDVPFNLAILDIDAANAALASEPGITTWAVGGHSLGGAMAAQYVASHPGAVRGLVLWAGYSASDLSALDVKVLSIYGSLDAGRPTFRSPENLARLPADTTYVEISGGNHEQFGWYTGQPNDPPATIARDEQQRQIAIATASFLATLSVPASE
jgi:pimeloyl-ACP methyl ester carboxylesterase